MQRKPQEFRAYFKTHDSYMEKFIESNVVLSHNLEPAWDKYMPGVLRLERRKIELSNDIIITVDKTWMTERQSANRVIIWTVDYTYHTNRRGGVPIFRYCSPHDANEDPNGSTDNHHQHHHKHIFDEDGQEVRIDLLAEDSWPTLAQVIEESYGI